MNKLFTTLATSLLVLGYSFGSIAQEANSLLWKVTGKDINQPSYIFGTIHMLPADKYFFTEKMQEALLKTDVLALEVDLNIPVTEQMKMASEMIIADGKTWADWMTKEEFALVKSAFVDSLGIKPKKVDKYAKIKPIYVSGLILSELLGKVKMYEKELTSVAKKAKKEIIGLETFQEQMEIVGSVSMEDQIEGLKKGTASMVRDYNEMLDAYTAQNLTELEKAGKESDGFDKMEEELLTKRNNRWVKTIIEMLHKTPTFYAVGAMHLVGENGLIHQLKENGYVVEPVL